MAPQFYWQRTPCLRRLLTHLQELDLNSLAADNSQPPIDEFCVVSFIQHTYGFVQQSTNETAFFQLLLTYLSVTYLLRLFHGLVLLLNSQYMYMLLIGFETVILTGLFDPNTVYTDIFAEENIFAEFAGEVYPRN